MPARLGRCRDHGFDRVPVGLMCSCGMPLEEIEVVPADKLEQAHLALAVLVAASVPIHAEMGTRKPPFSLEHLDRYIALDEALKAAREVVPDDEPETPTEAVT